MKKSKDVKQPSPTMGVRTRSKTHALQSHRKGRVEFLQLDSTNFKKVGGASAEVKKRQKTGGSDSGSCKSSKRKGKRKRKSGSVSDEERVMEEDGGGTSKEGLENEGKEDLGGVDDIGGAQPTVGDVGGVAEKAGDDDGGACGEVVAAENGGVDGCAAIARDDGGNMGGDVNGGFVDANGGDQPTICDHDVGGFVDAIGSDQPTGCDPDVAANARNVGGSVIGDVLVAGGGAAVSGCEGAKLGRDVACGDSSLGAGSREWLPMESTPEPVTISSDNTRTPSCSTKHDEFNAVERPQTEVGGNSDQHKELTTDSLSQLRSNYEMEKNSIN